MMRAVASRTIFGTGLIALDLVVGRDPETPVGCWAGGTCGNVLSILAWLGWEAYPVGRMNNDRASQRVRADMARWGVHLDWSTCSPTAHTPIIVQEVGRGGDGRPSHRFSWSCPRCGNWLPPFRAITINATERIKPALTHTSVFFLDRVSRATLTLAAAASAHGALVVFEPSSNATNRLAAEGLALAHVVKYAADRLGDFRDAMEYGSTLLLEVRTLGSEGLEYRHRLGRGTSNWIHLKAIPAPRVSDFCGCGDWCTAGFIAKAAVGGQMGIRRVGARGLRSALRYGQALAAWNCCFEGARGGMYAVTAEKFHRQIADLLAGQLEGVDDELVHAEVTEAVACPACSTDSGEIEEVSTQSTQRGVNDNRENGDTP